MLVSYMAQTAVIVHPPAIRPEYPLRIGLTIFSEAPQIHEPWTAMQAASRIRLRQPYHVAPRNIQMPLARRMAATIPHVGILEFRCGVTIPDQ